MKANRKFINEEDAVSPVIAVILMVAITVVLAATVFVLVNDLGKNVGSTGPSLGLVSDAAGSSTSQWTVKLSSATKLADLNDYKFVFSTPSHGTIVASPSATAAEFLSGYYMNGTWTGTAASRTDSVEPTGNDPANVPALHVGFLIKWTDIDGNGKLSVGDTIVIQYDDDTTDEGTPDSEFADTFAAGEYTLEILHTPSGSSSGSLPRTF